MAKQKEINQWLKENHYTKEDIDKFWDELKITNSKVKNLSQRGIPWDKLNMHVIKGIPTQKERDKEAKLQREMEKYERTILEQKTKVDENHDWDHFDKTMVKKIDAGERLTERELKSVVFETKEIKTTYGDNLRWTRGVTTIVEMCNRHFQINWDEGLTESQENEFYNQPVEVKAHTYEKTITVTDWIPIFKEKVSSIPIPKEQEPSTR